MVEITRLYTVEITSICKGEEKDIIPHDEQIVNLQEELKDFLDADDVLVTNSQDFIREVKD